MSYLASELVIDPVLLRRHDVSGPRYTSYPTADRFVEAFGAAELAQWLAKRNIGGFSQPLSLYVHVPFCDTLCYYCACNKVVTRDRSKSAQYINYLQKELDMVAPLLGSERTICQLHFGGGTPTFLDTDQLAAVVGALERGFGLAPAAQREYSIEVDPRLAHDTAATIAQNPHSTIEPPQRRSADAVGRRALEALDAQRQERGIASGRKCMTPQISSRPHCCSSASAQRSASRTASLG